MSYTLHKKILHLQDTVQKTPAAFYDPQCLDLELLDVLACLLAVQPPCGHCGKAVEQHYDKALLCSQ